MGLAFVSTPTVIFFTLLRSHTTLKTLYFEMYLASSLIVDCSDGLHCTINIAQILSLFYCMMSSLSSYLLSFISHVFCLDGIFYSSYIEYSGMCIDSKPWLVPSNQSICTKGLLHVWSSSKYNYWIFHKTCSR